MLGLMLGDAVGAVRGDVPDSGILRATSAGQLACFTAEGAIRASVRMTHKGICYPPGVVWHAYCRWAAIQGIAGVKPWSKENWPDGWLAQIPALSERRGSAPATVAAIARGAPASIDKPAGTSAGSHALIRGLPIGLWGPEIWPSGEMAAEAAATTHAGTAVDAAALGALAITELRRRSRTGSATEVSQAMRDAEVIWAEVKPRSVRPVTDAIAAAAATPRDASQLAQLVPDATAMSILAGAAYLVASFPEDRKIAEVLGFAAKAPFGRHLAPVVGALLGTVYGPDSLPMAWVSRLELAWVADVLAHDLVAEILDKPSGSPYFDPPDRHWWDRYPGW